MPVVLEWREKSMTHRTTIETLFSELWSNGTLELIDSLYCDDFVAHYHHPPRWGTGKAGVRTIIENVRAAFPNYQERVVDYLEAGDRVAVRIRITGTNTGSIGGAAGTGRSVDFEEIIIFRLHNGKIKEQWGVPDMLAMYDQLGLLKIPVQW